ncbi:two-component system sensor histidine kinase NtrB [Sutcliffiella cohnii]|uniref:two-component system sensor histidine kinase NtrB n=1 Tax=Sutcliffiella cohnii TaxID=33932 RepID=UPI002E1AAC73|nr:ATP-binding protein [Sutcliffiella cohnii]
MGVYGIKNKIDMVQVLNNITEPCFFLNTDWEFEFINDAAEPFLKTIHPFKEKPKKELLGMSIWDVLPKYKGTREYKLIHNAFQEQEPKQVKMQAKYSKRWFEIKAFPNIYGTFVMFSDITEKEENEKNKQFYEKLNVIREMASGVAHEVRNPITTVKGFLQIMMERNEQNQYKEIYHLMVDEINRVNEIITEFLDIAKEKPSLIETCNINSIIETLHPLLETRANKEGKMVVLHLGEVSPLSIDKNEIRQLLLNLINNALDAMGTNKKVEVITYEEYGDVVLSIRDEGSGIPSTIQSYVEAPFFTTKEHGTGLGLPICYSIVKRNNGTISFISGPEGTTFNIVFRK